LPKGHLAHHISDTVGRLERGRCHARRGKCGSRNQPFYPATTPTLAGECGLVKPGSIAVEGTAVKPRASRRKTGE